MELFWKWTFTGFCQCGGALSTLHTQLSLSLSLSHTHSHAALIMIIISIIMVKVIVQVALLFIGVIAMIIRFFFYWLEAEEEQVSLSKLNRVWDEYGWGDTPTAGLPTASHHSIFGLYISPSFSYFVSFKIQCQLWVERKKIAVLISLFGMISGFNFSSPWL